MSQNSEAKRPVKRSEVSKLQWTWQEMKNNKTAYFMLAPFLLLFIIFTVLPVVLSIFLSITDFNMLQMPSIVGGRNYLRLFLDDEIFILAIQNTLVFAAITGPVSYILALLVAWFINEPMDSMVEGREMLVIAVSPENAFLSISTTISPSSAVGGTTISVSVQSPLPRRMQVPSSLVSNSSPSEYLTPSP